ncbi:MULTISPECIES: serine hydrolase domain-containing protein [unclassified Rhizobium]|uniref:serine hydrolase domain-containing protein n=1 Tax=unclassified Rhizobium TaxID=2613769 RepID=UPI00382ED4DC
MTTSFPILEAGTLAGRIDPYFRTWSGENSPGVMLAVLSGGKVVHEASYGMADIANGLPLSSRSVVRIASQSKQFTTCLLLMLEREGLLSMQDPVQKHLPWLPHFEWPVTLHHLASNTSGLRDILEMMTIGGVPILAPSSRAYACGVVGRQSALNFEPGHDLLYSNSNFLLLSEILEEVSGKSFNNLLHERITGPLGMEDTRLMPRDDDIVPRLAVHHRRGPDGKWLKSGWGIAIGGEGGMVSSLRDMVVWQQNLRDPKVGDRTLFARMAEAGVAINGHPSPYGYGLVRDTSGPLTSVGHGGWIAGARSESVRFEEADLGIVMLSNQDDFAPYVLARTIAYDLLGVAAGQSHAGFDIAPGTYREEGGDDVFTIETDNGEPRLIMNMGGAPLLAVGNGKWQPQASIPAFALKAASEGAILAERFGRMRRFVSITPTAISLEAFVGRTFHAQSGDFRGETRMAGRDLQLSLSSPEGMQRVKLVAYGADFFFAHPMSVDVHDQWRVCPWVLPWLFTVRFTQGGMIINSDRTKRLTFKEV